MFDIGFWELILIAVIALLIVGPDRLPGFARQAGRLVGKIRRFINNARRELEREINLDESKEFRQQLSELDDLMKNAPDQDPDLINKLLNNPDEENTRNKKHD